MAEENIVSQPPLMTPISDRNGVLSKAWSIWFRDMYRRTAYKGGNAIDDNLDTLDEVIVQVTINADNIQNNAIDIAANDANIESNAEDIEDLEQKNDQQDAAITSNTDAIATNILAIAQVDLDLSTHEALTTAHGSNGDIVGFDDLATESLYGLVKRMTSLSDALTSSATTTSPNATAAPVAYDQTQIDSIVTLVNEIKADHNSLISSFNAAIGVLNNLISRSKTSGQMTT